MSVNTGDRTVDEVLTIGRQDIEANAQTKMHEVNMKSVKDVR